MSHLRLLGKPTFSPVCQLIDHSLRCVCVFAGWGRGWGHRSSYFALTTRHCSALIVLLDNKLKICAELQIFLKIFRDTNFTMLVQYSEILFQKSA